MFKYYYYWVKGKTESGKDYSGVIFVRGFVKNVKEHHVKIQKRLDSQVGPNRNPLEEFKYMGWSILF